MIKKYEDYRVEDFAADEDFRNWVRRKEADDELNLYWNNVKRRYPHKVEMMNQAEVIVINLRLAFATQVSQPINKSKAWAAIREQAIEKQPMQKQVSFVAWRYAAAVVVFVIAGIALFHRPTKEVEVNTKNGEHTTLSLPDQSTVLLGANSQIKYASSWNEEETREVWITGEGKFDVQHINTDSNNISTHHRFIVHVDNGVDVEVLGTSFIVKSRRGKTRIELESGAIQVKMNNQSERLTQSGQVIELNPATAAFETSRTDEVHSTTTALQTGMLELSNTSVQEIIYRMEDNYGVKIKVQQDSLLQRKVDGVLPLYNEQQAFKAISLILDVTVKKNGNEVILIPNQVVK